MAFNLEPIDKLMKSFVLSNEQLKTVSEYLLQEFRRGLSKSTHSQSTVKMFPTYVCHVPNGKEQGHFLALDLGGTLFRTLAITLEGKQISLESDTYDVPKDIMLGTGDQLFDHIADCLARFIHKKNLNGVKLPLAFTFSFPCLQKGLQSGVLVQWSKGYQCSGVVGEDVVRLLKEALDRRNDIDISVVALINDTTGTLMSCAYKNSECRIGLIIGTGTNACYMENLENIETLECNVSANIKQMIVNTEWGAFGDNGCLEFIRTKYDHDVDQASLNPGQHVFEKMISGMYLGELVRLLAVECINNGWLLKGQLTEKFMTPYSFKTKYVSYIETDAPPKFAQISTIFEYMGSMNSSEVDCQIIRFICSRLSTRAAYLVGAGMATILNRMKRSHTTIGIDGSVFRYHPRFAERMDAKIREMVDPNYHFDMMLSEDGSGKGAALVAAVAMCQQKEYILMKT